MTERPAILVLTERELRQFISLDETALATVEDSFARLWRGEATVPPIMIIEVPERHGEVDIKSAYIRGLNSFAVKIASGFFDNTGEGIPSSSGMMVLLSAKTGYLETVLLDNGFLTDVRTALAGAVAARYAAPEQVDTVGVIGAGMQARLQVKALRLVRDFRRVLVFARRPDAAAGYAVQMSSELGLEVTPASDAEFLVRSSQLVITTTPSRQPIVRAEWLHAGLHITALGSDGPEKRELEPDVVLHADHVVCDLKSQCFRLGELHHALVAGLITEEYPVTELGELIVARRSARRTEEDITLCDLTGVGVQDTAIALLAASEASRRAVGQRIDA
jgi:ectoine utilization protein EutC